DRAQVVDRRGHLEPRKAEPAEVAERRPQLRLDQALRRAQRLVDRREDQVLEHLRVVWVDRLRVDLDLADLAVARRGDGDHPAAGARLDGLVLELFLRLLHLALHLLDLLQHLVHVEAHSSLTSRASKVPFISSLISSSVAASSSGAPPASPPFSPTSKARASRRPVIS